MKIQKTSIILAFGLLMNLGTFAQKKVSEVTLVYDTEITTGSKDPKLADAFDGATTTIYIKGPQSRSEMVSALFTSTTIHDSKAGNQVDR